MSFGSRTEADRKSVIRVLFAEYHMIERTAPTEAMQITGKM